MTENEIEGEEDIRDKEIREYEEANFTRLTGKANKGNKKTQEQLLDKHNDMLADIGDFGDTAGLDDEEEAQRKSDAEYLRQKRLQAYMKMADAVCFSHTILFAILHRFRDREVGLL